MRTIITVSLPQDVADYLKKKINYSGYIASLVRADMKKETLRSEATVSTTTMTSEEQREAYLKQELVPGMTRKQVLDKIEEEWFDATGGAHTVGATIGTISQIAEVLGLSYSQVYNKVLPFLRAEGCKVT